MNKNQEDWMAESYFFQWLSQQHEIQFNTQAYMSPLVTEFQVPTSAERGLALPTSSELE